ncbi:hypothetical protein FOZ60_016649 [Perkinsus olseni]|uniref:JmjC domain-containing protein n=2 Tax=Perkinsus olseni TaxID=32597 RepID=A0A7J6PKG4_PEROL|nr:hypothetical protein FOZ60_016649 [Perkinsus olseni]
MADTEESLRAIESEFFPKPSPELPSPTVFRTEYLIPNRPGCFAVSNEVVGLSEEFAEDPVGWMMAHFDTLKHWYEILRHHEWYLKDWNFQSECEGLGIEPPYKCPEQFADDWLNPYWHSIQPKGGKDYRFMYWGSKGSTTPNHFDVMMSHSWTYNITGRKLWYFGARENEKQLRIEFEQGPGEVVFVPSGWAHSVVNLDEDTISVNHNWFCGPNVRRIYAAFETDVAEVLRNLDGFGVKRELDTQWYDEHVQLILKGNDSMDMAMLADCILMGVEKLQDEQDFEDGWVEYSLAQATSVLQDILSKYRSVLKKAVLSPCTFVVLGLCYGVVLVGIICSLIAVYIKEAAPVWVIVLISVGVAWLALGVAFKFVFSMREPQCRRLQSVVVKDSPFSAQRDLTNSNVISVITSRISAELLLDQPNNAASLGRWASCSISIRLVLISRLFNTYFYQHSTAMDRLHISFAKAVTLLVLWLIVIVTLGVVALVCAFIYHLSGIVVGSLIIVGGLIAVLGLVARRWIVVERDIKISEYYGKEDEDDDVKPRPAESIVTAV